jgi:hypothetical protein
MAINIIVRELNVIPTIRSPEFVEQKATKFCELVMHMEIMKAWSAKQWYLYFCDERCMQDWLKEHIANFMQIVGIKTKPSETPIEVAKELKQAGEASMLKHVINIKNNVLT